MNSAEEKSSSRIYDESAETYGFDISASLASSLKYELAKRYIRPSNRVLDVGCANGLFMLPLAPFCSEIVGIDISDKMLAIAESEISRCKLSNARVCKQSATELAFSDSSFDMAYCYSLLPLVSDPVQVVREIARVVRPGGIVLLDVPGRHNLSRLFFTWQYRRMGHPGVKSFRLADTFHVLADHKLEVLESHALGFTDQWKYVPGLHRCRFLNRLFHASSARDLDYRISNVDCLRAFANRWYIVCRRREHHIFVSPNARN
jgi:ubiquinone/menaquinone biosynthesis C-methylase UbiE